MLNLRSNSLPTHALSLLASATLLASLPAQAMHHESGEDMSGMDHEIHKKMHGDKDYAAMEAHMKDMKAMKSGMKTDPAMIASLTDEQIKAMNVAQLSDKSQATPHYMIGEWAMFSLTDGPNEFGPELFPDRDKAELN